MCLCANLVTIIHVRYSCSKVCAAATRMGVNRVSQMSILLVGGFAANAAVQVSIGLCFFFSLFLSLWQSSGSGAAALGASPANPHHHFSDLISTLATPHRDLDIEKCTTIPSISSGAHDSPSVCRQVPVPCVDVCVSCIVEIRRLHHPSPLASVTCITSYLPRFFG